MKDARLIALIERGQMRRLKAAAKREKITMAEAVRQAIDQTYPVEKAKAKAAAR